MSAARDTTDRSAEADDRIEPAGPTGPRPHDLVVVGGNAGGLSVAISSLRSGISLVRVVEPSSSVVFPDLVGESELDVGYGEDVASIQLDGDLVIVVTNKQTYRTRAVLVARRAPDAEWTPPIPAPSGSRVHIDTCPDQVEDQDVLIVGFTDHAVELAASTAAAGGRVVLAAGGMDPGRLSPAGERELRRLERERRATILYRSVPDQIGELDGFPMAYFKDRRTPDLQFDHVIMASGRQTLKATDVGLDAAAAASGKVWFLGESDPADTDGPPTAPGWRIGLDMAAACFPEIELAPAATPAERRLRNTTVIDQLREDFYNATITHFEPTHSDLWVLRVKPDNGDTSHLPGQYASLGLGYWEERVDDAQDPALDAKWEKLIRRSYSISSRMFDEHGYLTDRGGLSELEFYIVLVPPTDDNIPALTPRLALKRPGDRIYLGPKVAGRYTLRSVIDPTATILFLSTGTGEAPHNAMIIELLRKGHRGPIVSAVSVRQWADLGYRSEHDILVERYPNYHYLPLPTREQDVPKRYIQSVLEGTELADRFGIELDPAQSHVFLCGNPAMIGLPEEVDGVTAFPETLGVVEILTKRGFTLDRRNAPGNVHYEEYW